MNEKIEKSSRITYFAFVKLTIPGIMCPIFILSIILYFATDLGKDEYSLAFPMWYEQ